MKNYTQSEVKKAILGTGGIIMLIAKKLKCDWYSARKYIRMYPQALQELQDERERTKDVAEKNIIDALNKGDLQLSKWYLQTIGKDRGYGEELNLNGNFSVDIKNMTEEEIDERLKDTKKKIKKITKVIDADAGK